MNRSLIAFIFLLAFLNASTASAEMTILYALQLKAEELGLNCALRFDKAAVYNSEKLVVKNPQTDDAWRIPKTNGYLAYYRLINLPITENPFGDVGSWERNVKGMVLEDQFIIPHSDTQFIAVSIYSTGDLSEEMLEVLKELPRNLSIKWSVSTKSPAE